MPQQMIWFFVSMAFSFIAWGIVTARYIWPELRVRRRAEALEPLLILHSFRFIGLAVLVPGVVSPELPPAFAYSAAYGDVVAAILALLSLLLLRRPAGAAIAWTRFPDYLRVLIWRPLHKSRAQSFPLQRRYAVS